MIAICWFLSLNTTGFMLVVTYQGSLLLEDIFDVSTAFSMPPVSLAFLLFAVTTTSCKDWLEATPLHAEDRRSHFSFSRSEEHTSELQSRFDLVCRLLLE